MSGNVLTLVPKSDQENREECLRVLNQFAEMVLRGEVNGVAVACHTVGGCISTAYTYTDCFKLLGAVDQLAHRIRMGS